MNYSVFSFFSGSGLLDLGFEYNNYNIVFVNEYYKPFLSSYIFSRKKLGFCKPKYGYSNVSIEDLKNDISFQEKINKEKTLGNFFGFIGGPPCPDFSVGGKNKGKHGDNGQLTKTYFELISRKQPDFFIFENVKGLLKTKKHRLFFQEMIDFIKKSGYIINYKLLNALDFGVPQDRQRVILIGINKNKTCKKAPEIINNFNWGGTGISNHLNLFNWPSTNTFSENSLLLAPQNIPIQLTVEYWFNKNEVNTHQNSLSYFKPRSTSKFESIREGDVSKKSFKRLHRWRYSPTAAYGNNEVHLHPYKKRRISVSEALAIQSMPKEFVINPELSLTDQFKTVGNGVPFLLSYCVAFQIKQLLSIILETDKNDGNH
ncbi:DNA cytosine methyltransferase [Liquorilactobacillus hordei]|uniref:DNA cytosine methyltransferase n=1 Tax=Liquorilactobacillus hordei TaxID=468911 RepID=UPI001CC0F844|nr:DNA cytosine methyltransferase [Liquorilactobacillus hordei]MBZ2405150.1 hypothetical protein [Liquorilactobacillus hordei]